MNCKPGDLAVYVGKDAKDVGRIVVCVELASRLKPSWLVDPPLSECFNSKGFWCNGRFVDDSALRPIRDNDGEDETLTWAGKPQEVTQ